MEITKEQYNKEDETFTIEALLQDVSFNVKMNANTYAASVRGDVFETVIKSIFNNHIKEFDEETEPNFCVYCSSFKKDYNVVSFYEKKNKLINIMMMDLLTDSEMSSAISNLDNRIHLYDQIINN